MEKITITTTTTESIDHPDGWGYKLEHSDDGGWVRITYSESGPLSDNNIWNGYIPDEMLLWFSQKLNDFARKRGL